MHPLTIQNWHAMRAMAVVASVLAAYAAFSLADRVSRTERFWGRRMWLTGAATVLGLGMWSMHFLGALEDPVPDETVYSVPLVVLCLLVAISSGWIGLRLAAWKPVSNLRLTLGGLVIGAGATSMHFLGLFATRSTTLVSFRSVPLVLSVAVGLLLTVVALWMALGPDRDSGVSEWMRIGGSLVMGCGVALVHHLGVSALVVRSAPSLALGPGSARGSGVGETALLVTVGLVMMITLGTAAVDKRKYRELSALHAQLAASEQALLRSEGQLREANALLSELSIRDSLTGIYNRRRFDEVFDMEWKRSLRSSRPLALLMIDVDHFKSLNDSYGHQRGDECLREIARVIEEQPRRGHDVVARFGGEEFAVLLPGSDVPGARRIAENIRRSVEALQMEHRESKVSPWVTVSIGVCSRTPLVGESAGDVLYEADMALYLAKQLGRNRVEMRESARVEV